MEETKKLIFFDIDGTLIHHRKDKSYIPDSTIETVKTLKENGHTVAIASGRGLFQMKDLMDFLEIDKAVTSNGQEVIYGDKVIFREKLHKDEIKELIDYSIKTKSPFVVSSIDEVYLKDFEGILKLGQYMEAKPLDNIKEGAYIPEAQDFVYERDIDKDTYGFMLITSSFNEAHKYKSLSFRSWGDKGFEIGNKNITKLSGVKKMAESLGFDIDDVYVFGDGYNDVEMLKGIKNSIAMGNGVDEAKSAAGFITKHVGEDGIKYACEHFKLV